QPAGGMRTELCVRGPYDVRTAMLSGDTSGCGVVFLQLLVRGRPVGIPAELFQNRHSKSPLWAHDKRAAFQRLAHETRARAAGARRRASWLFGRRQAQS